MCSGTATYAQPVQPELTEGTLNIRKNGAGGSLVRFRTPLAQLYSLWKRGFKARPPHYKGIEYCSNILFPFFLCIGDLL